MKIKKIYSKSFDKKTRSYKEIKLIVIHYTGMLSEREAIIRLCNPKFKVSSHLLISKSGKIYRLVDDNKIAWHAGVSCWGKYKKINKCSIGIELTNKGHRFGYPSFKKKQLKSLIRVLKILIKKYKIKEQNIVGHSDIAPSRKIDPGEKFPWEELAKQKIGIWHNCNLKYLRKLRRVKISKEQELEFIKNLIKIGYCFKNKRKSIFTKTVKAFQRHYRKDMINGIIDNECLIIAKNILKRLKKS